MAAGGDGGRDAREFLRWFDLIGLQRHIKVLGIFARLWYRDGKRGYLATCRARSTTCAMPRGAIAELRDFSQWLEARLAAGAARAANARAGRACA